MKRSFLRQCFAYLLIALLPLQAVAAARLALCAEDSMGVAKGAMQTMEHCSQMTSMQQSSSSDTTKAHGNAACWLGSICIASFGVMGLPSTYQFAHIEHSAPSYFSPTALYLSVIPDTPQRPPNTL